MADRITDFVTTPLPIGGMHAGGAPQLVPDGLVRMLQNFLRRPGPVLERRPPLASADTLAGQTLLGHALWLDPSSGRIRTVLARTRNATSDHQLRVSSSAGSVAFADTYNGPAGQGVLTSYANHKGILYYCMSEDYSGTGRKPAGLHSFNGTTITQYPIGGETLHARCVSAFIDRLFLGYVRATVTNQLGTSDAYDISGWSNVTTTVENITNGSTITCRVTPTATTLSQRYKRNVYTVAASTSETRVVFLSQLRNTSPTYAMPMTVEVIYSEVWATGTAYAVDDIRVPTAAAGNGFHFRCTVAGTSDAVTEPTWPTNPGDTVTDGTVTWICAGKEAVASVPVTLQTATQRPTPTSVIVRAVLGAHPKAVKLGLRIKFGTTAAATIERHAVEMSYKDGLTDGDARKANWGQQFTVGGFTYPFFNAQSSASVTHDLESDLYWTEASDLNTILGQNFYRLREAPGPITAMVVAGNRLVVFKEFGIWVFAPNPDDARIPIVREQFIANVGCRGPRAIIVFGGKLYFIGNPGEVYEYEVGGEPRPLCGDAMRDWLFTSTGILSPGTAATYWSVAADEAYRDLYVTTRTGDTAVLDLDTGAWSIVKTGSVALGGMLYNPALEALYAWPSSGDSSSVASGYLKSSSTSALDVGTGTPAVITLIEWRLSTLFPRQRIMLHDVGLLNMSTGDQSAQTTKIEISLNGGESWTKSATFTLPAVTVANPSLADRTAVRGLRQSGNNMAVRLYQSGKGGGEMLRLAAADVVTQVLSEDELVTTNATITAATL